MRLIYYILFSKSLYDINRESSPKTTLLNVAMKEMTQAKELKRFIRESN